MSKTIKNCNIYSLKKEKKNCHFSIFPHISLPLPCLLVVYMLASVESRGYPYILYQFCLEYCPICYKFENVLETKKTWIDLLLTSQDQNYHNIKKVWRKWQMIIHLVCNLITNNLALPKCPISYRTVYIYSSIYAVILGNWLRTQWVNLYFLFVTFLMKPYTVGKDINEGNWKASGILPAWWFCLILSRTLSFGI